MNAQITPMTYITNVPVLSFSCSERFAVIVTEFKNRNGNSAAALPSDVHGFTRFFGELFMNLKVEKNGVFENYTVIGLAVVELLDSLAKTRSSENVKFVAQVLKVNAQSYASCRTCAV